MLFQIGDIITEILEGIGTVLGLAVLFIIPGVGAALAIVLFILLSIFPTSDAAPLVILLSASGIAFFVLIGLVIITFGLAAIIEWQNIIMLLILILATSNMIFDLLGMTTAAVIMFSFIGLAIVKKRKPEDVKKLCITFGEKEWCVGDRTLLYRKK